MIEVGDRVTYKNIFGDEVTRIVEITSVKDFLKDKEIIKIERPTYEIIEEKKELLTQEEKEFLNIFVRYYDVTKIIFNNEEIYLYANNKIVCNPDYPKNMLFENTEKYKEYTLSELGLED